MKTVIKVMLTAIATFAWLGVGLSSLPDEVTFVGILASAGIALIAVVILAFMKWLLEL